MKRIAVILPDDMSQALDREARRQGTSVSAIAREALAERLRLGGGPLRALPFAALGRSGEHDAARSVDEIIDAEWER